MTKTKINYSYPFRDFDKARLLFHCNQIYHKWKKYLADNTAVLFDRDDIISVIYELMENIDFRHKALCGTTQVFFI